MEAATPLRRPHVRTVGDSLAIDGLVVGDATAVRLVRDREEAGEDPARAVTDAIEIGARVLDREQAGAGAEYVKAELGKVTSEVERSFTDRAREVAELLGRRVDEVFAPQNGQLARELEKLFSDGSAASVQNRVREVVGEAMMRSREELVRQFSSADDRNPLADFKADAVRALHQAAARQDATQRALLERMVDLEKELHALRSEKEKREELGAERERGTAKGRTFEEQVADAVDAIAMTQGDDSEAVGDMRGASGRTGDVVVAVGGACGPERGRIVFEAKDRKLPRPEALRELDRALRERDADFAVLVVPSDEEVPARMHPLREYGGDKLVVTLDTDDPSRLPLELGYRLARARVLMARSPDDEVDAAAVRERVERALQAMDDVRKVKSRLTGAKKSIDEARDIVEAMAERVRARLGEIDALVLPDGGAQQTLEELD